MSDSEEETRTNESYKNLGLLVNTNFSRSLKKSTSRKPRVRDSSSEPRQPGGKENEPPTKRRNGVAEEEMVCEEVIHSGAESQARIFEVVQCAANDVMTSAADDIRLMGEQTKREMILINKQFFFKKDLQPIREERWLASARHRKFLNDKALRNHRERCQCEQCRNPYGIDSFERLPPNVTPIPDEDPIDGAIGYNPDNLVHTSRMKFIEQDDKLPKNFLRQINARRRNLEQFRCQLIDWLYQVQMYFRRDSEVVHMAMAIVDRYVCRIGLNLDRYQLYGITAFFIAVKKSYRHVDRPRVRRLAYLTQNSYTTQEILQCELDIYLSFQFKIHFVLPMDYVLQFLQIMKAVDVNLPNFDTKTGEVDAYMFFLYSMQFVSDLVLLDPDLCVNAPSEIAASILYILRISLLSNLPPWNSTLEYFTEFTGNQLLQSRNVPAIARHLQAVRHLMTREDAARTVYDRYKRSNFAHVAVYLFAEDIFLKIVALC